MNWATRTMLGAGVGDEDVLGAQARPPAPVTRGFPSMSAV